MQFLVTKKVTKYNSEILTKGNFMNCQVCSLVRRFWKNFFLWRHSCFIDVYMIHRDVLQSHKKPSWKRSEMVPVHPSPKRKIICTYVIPQDVGLTCSYKCLLLGFLSIPSQISCVHVTQISFIIVLACYFSFCLTGNRERLIFFSNNFSHVWRLLLSFCKITLVFQTFFIKHLY